MSQRRKAQDTGELQNKSPFPTENLYPSSLLDTPIMLPFTPLLFLTDHRNTPFKRGQIGVTSPLNDAVLVRSFNKSNNYPCSEQGYTVKRKPKLLTSRDLAVKS